LRMKSSLNRDADSERKKMHLRRDADSERKKTPLNREAAKVRMQSLENRDATALRMQASLNREATKVRMQSPENREATALRMQSPANLKADRDRKRTARDYMRRVPPSPNSCMAFARFTTIPCLPIFPRRFIRMKRALRWTFSTGSMHRAAPRSPRIRAGFVRCQKVLRGRERRMTPPNP
jgi:hypothetical protein